MQFDAKKNITQAEIEAMIEASKHKAVRRIADPRNGDLWYWKAELGTHAEAWRALRQAAGRRRYPDSRITHRAPAAIK